MTITRLLAAAGLVAVAVVVSALLRRRQQPSAPSQPSYGAPSQLDRADFPTAAAEWLVVVFTSASCHTCADVAAKAMALASRHVSVIDAEFGTNRELHQRYRIDAVPITVLCDGAGVVRARFMGPVSATDLWAAVAEAREPGSSPEPGLGAS